MYACVAIRAILDRVLCRLWSPLSRSLTAATNTRIYMHNCLHINVLNGSSVCMSLFMYVCTLYHKYIWISWITIVALWKIWKCTCISWQSHSCSNHASSTFVNNTVEAVSSMAKVKFSGGFLLLFSTKFLMLQLAAPILLSLVPAPLAL